MALRLSISRKKNINYGFQDSRIHLLTVVQFTYPWCEELMSVEFYELQLGKNRSTTVDWNNYMREMRANLLVSLPLIKIGASITKPFEVDETYLFQK